MRTSSPLPTKRKNHATKTNLPSSARASHPFIFNTFNFNYLLIHPSNVTLVIIQTRNLDRSAVMFQGVSILIHGCQGNYVSFSFKKNVLSVASEQKLLFHAQLDWDKQRQWHALPTFFLPSSLPSVFLFILKN